MAEAQAVTIEVDDEDVAGITDTNEAGAVKKPAVDPGVAGISDLRGQLDKLTRKSEESDRRASEAEAARIETERRAREEVARSREDAAKARGESAVVSKAAIKSAIDGTTATIANAKTAIQAAWEAGDFAKASELNEQMAAAAARKARLEADLDALPEPVTHTQTEQRRDPAQMTEQERFDAYIASIAKNSPKSAAWLRAHPEYATDDEKNHLVLAADRAARKANIRVDSEEYFAFVEHRLGLDEDAGDVDTGATDLRAIRDTSRQQPRQQQPRKTPMTSAPVTRGDGPTDGGRTSVTLTPGEVSNATDGTLVWNYDDKGGRFKRGDPIGVDEMARRKRALSKEGRYMQAEG